MRERKKKRERGRERQEFEICFMNKKGVMKLRRAAIFVRTIGCVSGHVTVV